jgi:methylmalonyl-CoA/ethylmalonyl-CoA epimerase
MELEIDHIGIAVRNVEDMVQTYCKVLGIKPEDIERETVEEHRVKTALIPLGQSRIELLEPIDSKGAIAKFIDQRGEGIHHLAIGVRDIKAVLGALKEKSVPLIDAEPRIGVGGTKVAFMHPKVTKALLEIVEK